MCSVQSRPVYNKFQSLEGVEYPKARRLHVSGSGLGLPEQAMGWLFLKLNLLKSHVRMLHIILLYVYSAGDQR